MEILDKDVLFLIAVKMDILALLNFCQICKFVNGEIHTNDNFWNSKLKEDFKIIYTGKESKNAYKLLYIINKSTDFLNFSKMSTFSEKAAEFGCINLWHYVIKRLQQLFLKKWSFTTCNELYLRFLGSGLSGAIKSGNINFVKYLVEDFQIKVDVLHVEMAKGEILEYLLKNIDYEKEKENQARVLKILGIPNMERYMGHL